jgi:hypothetical protein
MKSISSLADSARKNDLSTGQTLTLIGLAALATLLIGATPWLGLINYSFRLLVTIVHELSHGLAAIVTGGDFINFIISPDGSGLAMTRGGWRFVVIPAGYLGAALFGATLVILGRSSGWSRIAMAVIGLAMALLSLRFGVPTIFKGQILGGLLTTTSGLIFGALFLLVAFKASARWVVFLLHVVAIRTGLTAFSDIFYLIMGSSSSIFNAPRSDAQSMAELTFIPAIIWAIVWAVIAVLLIGGAIWITWIASSPMNQEYTTGLRKLRP